MLLPTGPTSALENIYISPLEICNLNCRLCYTHKTKAILTNPQIQNFTRRYQKYVNLKSILFCGGELFLLPKFPNLVNYYTRKNIFVSLITNGTINRLSSIKQPNHVQLLVSLDGPEKVHNQNRGLGNYQKTLSFIQSALSLGFHLEIMYLVTPASYAFIDILPVELANLFGQPIAFNYLTLKTKLFTACHSLCQNVDSPGLSVDQIINIKKNYPSIPSKNFGCSQLSLQSNGLVYGCCESPNPLGKISTPVPKLIASFTSRLTSCQSCPSTSCHGCSDRNFLCGYKQELGQTSCLTVAPLFA